MSHRNHDKSNVCNTSMNFIAVALITLKIITLKNEHFVIGALNHSLFVHNALKISNSLQHKQPPTLFQDPRPGPTRVAVDFSYLDREEVKLRVYSHPRHNVGLHFINRIVD
jgi:hypothetical protein